MRCYPDALSISLEKSLAPYYLLYGNELLLIEESATLVRTTILSSTEVEHMIFHVDNANSTILSSLSHALQDRSLFSSKRLIEIQISSKLSASDLGHIEKILQTVDDTLLFVYNNQLSRQNQQAKWFTTIEQKGFVVAHWPLSPAQFSKWIEKRIKDAGLKMAPEALRLLIYHTEGNCLAAKQEIERLALYCEDLPKTATITQLEQQSQFDVFDLCESALQGSPLRIIKILNSLKTSGTPGPHLLWSMAQTLRVLLRCSLASSQVEKQNLLQQSGIPAKSHQLYLTALKTIQIERCKSLLGRLSLADKRLKSGENSAFWRELLEVSVSIRGNNA